MGAGGGLIVVGPTRWVGPFGTWGSVRPVDLTRPLPCDQWVDRPDQVLHRAVDVAAPPDLTFRWVGQLRLAPYSYDWIDNLGRPSPRELDGDLAPPSPGERINTIFRVVHTEPGRSITMRFAADWFGEVVCTYLVEPIDGGSRILVRFPIRYARGPAAALASWVLPGGDLVMMRRQLQRLARLATASAA